MGDSIMADDLIDFKINDASLTAFGQRFKAGKKKQVKVALGEIRREWQAEFVRQDRRMQRLWTPLKTWVDSRRGGPEVSGGKVTVSAGTDPKSYAARKRRAYYRGKGGKGEVRYLRILKRTGRMLDGYINGIRIDDVNFTVSIPFPSDPDVNIRARSHQGRGVGLPKGVLSTRKYDLDSFERVARREIKRALLRN